MWREARVGLCVVGDGFFDLAARRPLPLSDCSCSAHRHVIWAQQRAYKPTAVLKDTT